MRSEAACGRGTRPSLAKQFKKYCVEELKLGASFLQTQSFGNFLVGNG